MISPTISLLMCSRSTTFGSNNTTKNPGFGDCQTLDKARCWGNTLITNPKGSNWRENISQMHRLEQVAEERHSAVLDEVRKALAESFVGTLRKHGDQNCQGIRRVSEHMYDMHGLGHVFHGTT